MTMSDGFIYRPHVHTPDGVLTPDLVIERLLLTAGPNGRQSALGVNLLTTARTLHDPTETGCASAALVFVSGGRGTVVTVGSAHWDAAGGSDRTIPSEQFTPKPIAREAIRIDRLGRDRPGILATYRRTANDEVRIGQTSIAELSGLSDLMRVWSGTDAPKRSALLISVRHTDPEPMQATGYRVTLVGIPGVPDLEVAYRVHRLTVQN